MARFRDHQVAVDRRATAIRTRAGRHVGPERLRRGGPRAPGPSLEKGGGSPLVLLHGTTASAGIFLPLLDELDGVRALAPDRPGHGLSDPIDLPRDRFRESVVEWLDQLLDALDVDAPALLGHSAGGIWALWYALARPDRVERLVLIAPPAVPGTRCPLPIRLMATPGLGALMSRLVPPVRSRCSDSPSTWANTRPLAATPS